MGGETNFLARLADEDGKLLDERSKFELLRGSHSILVPRELQIVECDGVPCIQYSVPKQWPPEAVNARLFALMKDDLWTWEKGERFSDEALQARMRRGFHGNMRGGANSSGLLPAFLRLAHEDCSLYALLARVIMQVETFVKQWGPLWMCTTPAHHAHGRQCYWEPGQAVYWGGETTLCTWRPVEEVFAFVQEAREAKAFLQAAGRVRQGLPVEKALWDAVGVYPPGNAPSAQQGRLVSVLQVRLAAHGPLQQTILFNTTTPPKIHLVSKVGFLPAVWTEIAQHFCSAKGFYQCSNCGEWYSRKSRQPPKGQNNYCETCAEGNRGAARQSNQRRRALERRARQSDAEGVPIENIVPQLQPEAGRIKVDRERVQKWIG